MELDFRDKENWEDCLDAFRSAMEAAGIQDVLQEMQSQVDAFIASSN